MAAVDAIRGFALLGILVMNSLGFALPGAAYINPTFGSDDALDWTAWGLSRALVDLRFMALFSLLFGASLALAPPHAPARTRLALLVLIGLAHGFGAYSGDVLAIYGVVGFVALALRSHAATTKAWLGAALFAVPALLLLVLAVLGPSAAPEAWGSLVSMYAPSDTHAEVEAFRGGLTSQWPLRSAYAIANYVEGGLFDMGWRALGGMLLGMALLESGFFEGQRPRRLGVIAAVSLLLTLVGIAVQVASGFSFRGWLVAQALQVVSTPGVATGIAWLVVRATRLRAGSAMVEALAALGRFALTAYLTQSLLGLVVFTGVGFAAFGHLDRMGLLLFSVAVWLAQLALAWRMRNRTRRGPLEGLLRGATRRVDRTLARLTSPRPIR